MYYISADQRPVISYCTDIACQIWSFWRTIYH